MSLQRATMIRSENRARGCENRGTIENKGKILYPLALALGSGFFPAVLPLPGLSDQGHHPDDGHHRPVCPR